MNKPRFHCQGWHQTQRSRVIYRDVNLSFLPAAIAVISIFPSPSQDNCTFGVLDSLAGVTGDFSAFLVLQVPKWKFPSTQRRASAIRGRTWTFLREERNEFERLHLVRNPGPIPNVPGFAGAGCFRKPTMEEYCVLEQSVV